MNLKDLSGTRCRTFSCQTWTPMEIISTNSAFAWISDGKLNEALDKSFRWTSFRKLERCQPIVRLSRDNIYSDILTNEQPSYLTIISLYTLKHHTPDNWFDIIRFSRIATTSRYQRDSLFSLFLGLSFTLSFSLTHSLFLSLSLLFFFFLFFFTHYESIDHPKRELFHEQSSCNTVSITLFVDSLVPFSA